MLLITSVIWDTLLPLHSHLPAVLGQNFETTPISGGREDSSIAALTLPVLHFLIFIELSIEGTQLVHLVID